ERIVGRHRTVVVQAQDLAEVGLHVLRRIELLPFAGTDPQLAVGAEQQAMAVVAAAGYLRYLAPDDLQVGQRAAGSLRRERRARDRRAARVALARLGVAQVDLVVARVVRMQRDVAETALAAVVH